MMFQVQKPLLHQNHHQSQVVVHHDQCHNLNQSGEKKSSDEIGSFAKEVHQP